MKTYKVSAVFFQMIEAESEERAIEKFLRSPRSENAKLRLEGDERAELIKD